MYKLFKQLLVEGLLSGAKPYIASHPELGVPIGIFNIKNEPTAQSRINTIKLYGKKGNPISYLIAKLLGIENPIPSYLKLKDERGNDVTMSQLFRDPDFKAELRRSGYTQDKGPSAVSSKFQIFEQLAQERTPKEQLTVGEIEKMVNLTKELLTNRANVGKQTKTLINNMETVLDILALEDTLRVDMSRNIGMSNEQILDTINLISEAAVETAAFNVRAYDLFETFKDITETIGRNLTIEPEVLKKASILTKTLEGFDAGAFADSFDTIGMNLTDAMGKVDDTDNTMQDILDTGRGFGAVMKDFTKSIGEEMKLINTYGFHDGVEGLSRMVARSQVLGLSIERVKAMALDFLEPEKAIDFAAQMQVIGGAVGDLTDPFKLMYMATNDLEGLHKAIADTAEAAVHFDKEKGKFSISPDQRRQLKAQADAMGMDYQELADTAIKAAKRSQVFDQFAGNIPDKDKELIASMAQISKGGTAQIKVPGIEELLDVDDLTEKELSLLRREGMKDTDVYKQQLTVAEKANQYLASLDAVTRLQLKTMMKSSDVDKAIATETLTQQVVQAMPNTATAADIDILRSGDMSEITKLLKDKMPDADVQAEFTKKFNNLLNVKDFILTEDQVIQFQEDDLLIGGTKLGETLSNLGLGGEGAATSSLDIISNMGNQSPTGMSGGKGMVELTGTITLEGGGQTADIDINRFIKKLSDNSNNVQALNSVIMRASNT